MPTKYCKWCQQEKEIGMFHANKLMKDGRLNKCSECVVKAVFEWREKNPSARKIEHAKRREKEGFGTREQYFARLKDGAIGRRASALSYYYRNKDKQAEWAKKDRESNPEKYRERRIRDREKALAQRPNEYRALKSRVQNKRRAAKLQRIPLWHDEFITSGMYELCSVFRAIGIDMTVDHIVPLQGRTVCGLHTHDNLQLMTRGANSSKHINFWPEQP